MNSLLEEYLEEVAAHLTPLPTMRRAEELNELRQHLLQVYAANQEQGQSEDEAAQAALQHFGRPEAVGQDIEAAWRRGELIRLRSFWGAAISTPVVLGVLVYSGCGYGLLTRLWPSFNAFFLQQPVYGEAIIHALFFLCYGLTGMIVGGVFRKQAVKGLSLGLAVSTLLSRTYPDDVLWLLTFGLAAVAVGVAFPTRVVRGCCFALVVVALLWTGRGSLTIPAHPRQLWFRLEETGWLLTAVLFAWVMCRLGRSHARLARA